MSKRIPVVMVNAEQAENAWLAHQAVVRTEAAYPDLRDNPAWTIIRQDAYERFALAFQEVK